MILLRHCIKFDEVSTLVRRHQNPVSKHADAVRVTHKEAGLWNEETMPCFASSSVPHLQDSVAAKRSNKLLATSVKRYDLLPMPGGQLVPKCSVPIVVNEQGGPNCIGNTIR